MYFRLFPFTPDGGAAKRKKGPNTGLGSHVHPAKLTLEQVREIRAFVDLYGNSRANQRLLAEKYGVSWYCIYSVGSRLTHVTVK